jgi:CheY-like chemotaxis protein
MRFDILIVEDNAPTRDALALLLELQGYGTALAHDGAEALAYLRAHAPPRLILLDLMMPVMDGRQFLWARRSEPHLGDIPVVLCTAERRIDRSAAQALGADDLLHKPVDPNELLDAVRHYG